MTKKGRIITIIFSLSVSFLLIHSVYATDFGLNAVNEGLNGSLASGDPRIIIGRIIQFALGFLGIIAVSLTIYAGFLWMTSAGKEEQISKAKDILKNAIIGLVIILAAWAITTFLISRLFNATNGNSQPREQNPIVEGGLGTVGACTVESFYPNNNQKNVTRNTSIIVSFKEEIDLKSVCIDGSDNPCECGQSGCNLLNPETIRIYDKDLGDACTTSCPDPNTNISEVVVAPSNDHKTIILTPLSVLGSAEHNTWYTVKITSDLENIDGKSMFNYCSVDNLIWSFEVNTKFDLTPPQVQKNGVFPPPDNEKDVITETEVQAATGSITVNDCLHAYEPAKVLQINPQADVTLDYHGNSTFFSVSVPADNENKARLFDKHNNLLGITDWIDNVATFSNYFSISVDNHSAGSLWNINISPERLADTLDVGQEHYVFADNNSNNNILIDESCSMSQQANNIYVKLSGNPDVNVDKNGNIVILTAKVAGENGNNINIDASTRINNALSITPMSGGKDANSSMEIKDKKDVPKNSVIQINFNEAVNPITVAGTADEVKDYIRIVNADGSLLDGTNCSLDSDCASYKCSNGICQGDYLSGKFVLTNLYRTLEFISDNECGVNGCGEKIYCLPSNSHLAIKLITADLKSCNDNSDCSALAPYTECKNTVLGYKTCQYGIKNYPSADLNNLNGIVDASLNSLDGNRDFLADGPIAFFNENNSDIDKKDKYQYSFYVNDKIMLDPPKITAIIPSQGASNVALAVPVKITFNTLMMNSSLRTGSVIINNGLHSYEHKLINIRSSIEEPLGYWIANENKDISPVDGVPDVTISEIKHSTFSQSVSYKPQVGSGVKDIYQNCFKPSDGPSCDATVTEPSCCFGVATDTLGEDGNCQ